MTERKGKKKWKTLKDRKRNVIWKERKRKNVK